MISYFTLPLRRRFRLQPFFQNEQPLRGVEDPDGLHAGYVIVHGRDEMHCRELMAAHFKREDWAFQYPSAKACGVEEFRLVLVAEIGLPE